MLNFGRAEVLHGVLTRRGVQRPLWAVAWGWCAEELASATETPWGTHPAREVRGWIPEAWSLARMSWPWLGPMFLWRFQPAAQDAPEQWCYALVDREGRPTKLWPALLTIGRGVPTVSGAPEQAPIEARWLKQAAALASGALLVGGGLLLGWRSLRRLGARVRVPLERLANAPDRYLAALWLAAVALAALPAWPASLVAVPMLVLLAAVRPHFALAAVAAAAPFYFRLRLYAGPRPFGSVELLIAVALGGRLVAHGLRLAEQGELPRLRLSEARLRQLRLEALDVLPTVLVAWSATSLLWTSYRGVAAREWRTVILEPVIYYALLRTSPDRRSAVRAALAGTIAGGLVAALWGLAGVGLTRLGLASQAILAEGVLRAHGPYGSPNNLALYLGRLVPLLAVALLHSRRWRWALIPAAAVIGLALVATFSRGALLVGLPVAAVYLTLVHRTQPRLRRRTVWLTILAALLVVGLLAPFASSQRLSGAFQLAPGSTLFMRLRLWQSSLAMLGDHWLLGVGLDNFLPHYRDTYVQRDVVQERFLSHPHNWILDWWLRLGVTGPVLFCGLVIGNLRCARRLCARHRALPGLAAVGVGMQVYTLAHGLVDQSFFLVDLALLWWISQSAVLAAGEEPSCGQSPGQPDESGPSRIRTCDQPVMSRSLCR